MPLDLTRHPCFNESARKTAARIHLPVAPLCNIQCQYCRRGYDCVNESRPGVASAVLSPGQALHYLEEMVRRDPRLSVVGIAGPGDPFANDDATMETLRLVRERFSEMLLCVATNGLNVAPYVDELARLDVSHVTLTINAVDAEIGERIYAWVRDGRRVYRGRAAAQLLLDRQLAAVAALKRHDVLIKINSIIIPGINEQHVPEVARRVAELGANVINCVPLYPVAGTLLGQLDPPSKETVHGIRHEAAKHLPIMAHCTRCRADAVGLLGQMPDVEAASLLRNSASLPLRPQDDRPHVAVATREGVLVNQHLGEAQELAIFARAEDGFRKVGCRVTPAPGGGQQRWHELAGTLHDCRALLTSGAGESPRDVLEKEGIRVVLMEGMIEEGLDAVYRNVEIRAPLRVQHRCGSGCAGNGTGCA